jgi:DNA anti-recombination protein RmuC
MAKLKQKEKLNFIVSTLLVIAVLAILSVFASNESENVPKKNDSSVPVTNSAENEQLPTKKIETSNVVKNKIPTEEEVAKQEEAMRKMMEPITELTPEMKAQLENTSPELPEDLRQQLLSPPSELPDDLKAQLLAPPQELPDDIKKALQTPPRIVSPEEVNGPGMPSL